MNKNDLIAYLEHAKTLEFAIHTNNELKKAYLEEFAKTAPLRPELEQVYPENRPISPSVPRGKPLSAIGKISMVMCYAFIAYSFIANSENSASPFLILYLLFITVAISVTCYIIQKPHIKYKQQLKKYEAAMQAYNMERDKLANVNKEKLVQYENAMKDFHDKTDIFLIKQAKIEQEFTNLSNDLTSALTAHYNNNVIYPKYRNISAVTTIYEYLSSGRCSEFEGPNGAYNLYETEMRDNFITGVIAESAKNLEDIKNSQYIVYRELVESYKTIRNMLLSVGNELELANYYAGVREIIASSPQIETEINI